MIEELQWPLFQVNLGNSTSNFFGRRASQKVFEQEINKSTRKILLALQCDRPTQEFLQNNVKKWKFELSLNRKSVNK